MFENLSERLSGVFDRLTKQGALSEEDVKTALREVRVALLEADVSLPVARDFVKAVQEKATGQAVTKSVTPGQQVVKIVQYGGGANFRHRCTQITHGFFVTML